MGISYTKQKLKYFSNLNIKNVTENKRFWKTIKPCFSNKSKNSERIVLTENDKIVMEDGKVALKYNMFFSNIVISLNIPKFNQTILALVLSKNTMEPVTSFSFS